MASPTLAEGCCEWAVVEENTKSQAQAADATVDQPGSETWRVVGPGSFSGFGYLGLGLVKCVP